MKTLPLLIICIYAISCTNASVDSKQPEHKVSSLVVDTLVVDTSTSVISASYSEVSTKIIDSAKVAELIKFVEEKKDEYQGLTWIKPKTQPKYRNANGIYCYFAKDGDRAFNFRFVIQYYSDEWLFIKNIRFIIDGKPYSYTPNNMKTDNGYGGMIWEWFDESISGTDKDLIEALANAKTAKMKLVGSQYYDEKTITAKQLKAIKDVYELYTSMGGTFY